MTIWMLIVLSVMIASLLVTQVLMYRICKRHEQQIDNLETCLAKLAEVVSELKEDEHEVPDKDNRQFVQDFVNTVVGYNPFNKG